MPTAEVVTRIDEYLLKRLMPVEGAIPHLQGIEMYGNSIPAGTVGGDLFEYINFQQRYDTLGNSEKYSPRFRTGLVSESRRWRRGGRRSHLYRIVTLPCWETKHSLNIPRMFAPIAHRRVPAERVLNLHHACPGDRSLNQLGSRSFVQTERGADILGISPQAPSE